jgi:GT2 family glycosyltransferase
MEDLSKTELLKPPLHGQQSNAIRTAFNAICKMIELESYIDDAKLGTDTTAEEAAEHYQSLGWKENISPVAWFSPFDYIAANPDIAASDYEPFTHFLVKGIHEKRMTSIAVAKEYETISTSGLFDSEYYLKSNPDLVGSSSFNPLLHFILFGWKEGRKPNPYFDPRDYNKLHPDVARAKINPLYHYTIRGKAEGRRINKDDIAIKQNQPYEHWLERIEPIGLAHLRSKTERLLVKPDQGPSFAIITPCYNTDPDLLNELVTSVLNQTYGNWHLYLVDDCSTQAATQKALAKESQRDARITLIKTAENGNISRATNTGIAATTEDWVSFLDHDDLLTPDALISFAHYATAHQEARLIYSDEDKLIDGKRIDPHFKSDWNPTLLRAQNYICHMVAVRKDLLKAVGPFNPDFDGAQDHDFLLRCSEQLQQHEVQHIPWICYHWRMIEGSTAAETTAKPESWNRGRKAVEAHLKRINPHAQAELGPAPHTYRAQWPIPSPEPSVELIIPTRNGGRTLNTCIQSILKTAAYPNLQITIVDNQSDEAETLKLFETLQALPSVRVLDYDQPFNYSALNNWAVAQSRAEIIGLINDDIEATEEGWLQEMVSYAIQPEVGAVGAKLLYPDEAHGIQHAGVIIGLGGVAGHSHKKFARSHVGYHYRLSIAQQLCAVTAACLLVRRKVFNEVGGLNEEHLTVAFNDVDLCLKIHKAGYQNIWTPFATLLHHESFSRGGEDTPEKRARFLREMHFIKAAHQLGTFIDPFYSPHLTRGREDFSIIQNINENLFAD